MPTPLFLLITILTALTPSPTTSQINGLPILERDYWERDGKEDLEAALKVKMNTGIAKNVILFIADGMGPITVTASRIYNGGETSHLVWEKFDHVGLIKTYTLNKQVPDSASTATSLLTGYKVNYATMGLDGSVAVKNCSQSLDSTARLKGAATWAQKAGKATGVVTNTRITHATPGAVYAHSAHRDWECDAKIPTNAKECKDIARQLVEDEPGKNLNVVMGGGRQCLSTRVKPTASDPVDKWGCQRNDSRDLIDEWMKVKKNVSSNYVYVKNTGELAKVDTDKVDNLLGLFGNSHLSYNYARDKTDEGQPSLELMTTTAIKILNRNPKGFFLMVEGGLIDQAHHRGRARVALDEVVELNKAVNATISLLDKLNIKDETLLIVTSDHSHTLSINGYPDRGNSILGIADRSLYDGVNYTTLSYGINGKENLHYEVINGTVKRRDPSLEDTESWDYHQETAFATDEGKHGGGDVNIYAIGPMAHLFHRVHEQSYVAHVIQYAAQIGRYQDRSIVNSCSSLISSLISVALATLCLRFF